MEDWTSVKALVGRVITGIKRAADKKAIKIETTEGDVIAYCEGDCCSETWVEGISTPALGFPATVLSSGAVGEMSRSERNEELQFYGFKIVTDRGDIIIDYRNESNGYYGGSLSWPGDAHYAGVYQQNHSEEEWTDVLSE